jgi:hypothetical protein
MVPLATDVIEGRLAADSAAPLDALRQRDHRYRLEVDVAQFLSPFAGTLATLHPEARFVLLLRDCFSWLDSRVEKIYRDRQRLDSLWGPWIHALYASADDRHAHEEEVLRTAGLYPVAAYLRAWAAVNDGILRTVPADRLLVVRTEDLSGSIDRVAAFVGVPASKLIATHTNQAPLRTGVLAEVPPAFIVARARELCSPLMERYWGSDWIDLADRPPTST